MILSAIILLFANVAMAMAKPPLTTHILDTTVGFPAANVEFILFKQNQGGVFVELESGATNSDGRGAMLDGSLLEENAIYKLRFEVDLYFASRNIVGFYPYVEIVFRVIDSTLHHHVPLLLTPFGYTTYRGS